MAGRHRKMKFNMPGIRSGDFALSLLVNHYSRDSASISRVRLADAPLTSCEAVNCAGLKCIHLSLTRETEDRVAGKLNVGCRAGPGKRQVCAYPLTDGARALPGGPHPPISFVCRQALMGPFVLRPPLSKHPHLQAGPDGITSPIQIIALTLRSLQGTPLALSPLVP